MKHFQSIQTKTPQAGGWLKISLNLYLDLKLSYV